MNVNCHHANQDKFWVKDPDGVEWEVYYLNYNLLRAKRPRRRAGRAASLSSAQPHAAAALAARKAQITVLIGNAPHRTARLADRCGQGTAGIAFPTSPQSRRRPRTRVR